MVKTGHSGVIGWVVATEGRDTVKAGLAVLVVPRNHCKWPGEQLIGSCLALLISPLRFDYSSSLYGLLFGGY